MKLTAKIFISLDGVYQGGGGPDEDRRDGFDRGGWQASHADAELGSFITSAYENADAMLLGRVTWSIWEGYWPLHDDNPIGHTINVLPKYVPSTTLTDSTWHNTHFLSGDLEAAVERSRRSQDATCCSRAAATSSDGCSIATSSTSSPCSSTRSSSAPACGSSRSAARRST